MYLIRPPITGDLQLDAWTDKITNSINQGLLPGQQSAESFGGVGSGVNGNTAIFLYTRTSAADVVPTPPTNVTYDLETTPKTITATGGSHTWQSSLTEFTDTNRYLWVTFRYVADQSGVITDSNSWDTPVLLGLPGDDVISVDVSVVSGAAILRSDSDAVTIRADVYRGGSLLTPGSWSYQWYKDGTALTAGNQASLTGATQGAGQGYDQQELRIEGDGITDGTSSLFKVTVIET